MTLVRTSPYTRHLWRALLDEDQCAIEDAVPAGHFISVIYRTSLTDLTVRLFRETDDPRTPELVAMREHQRDIERGIWAVLRDAVTA